MYKGPEGYTLLQPNTEIIENPKRPPLENHEVFRHQLSHREEEDFDELFNEHEDHTKILFFPRGPFILMSLVLLVLIIFNVTGKSTSSTGILTLTHSRCDSLCES